MKKAELEEAYRELQYRYNKLHSDSREELKDWIMTTKFWVWIQNILNKEI